MIASPRRARNRFPDRQVFTLLFVPPVFAGFWSVAARPFVIRASPRPLCRPHLVSFEHSLETSGYSFAAPSARVRVHSFRPAWL